MWRQRHCSIVWALIHCLCLSPVLRDRGDWPRSARSSVDAGMQVIRHAPVARGVQYCASVETVCEVLFTRLVVAHVISRLMMMQGARARQGCTRSLRCELHLQNMGRIVRAADLEVLDFRGMNSPRYAVLLYMQCKKRRRRRGGA